MSIWQTFKEVIGYEDTPKANTNVGDLMDADASKSGITMIGTMGAGKSAHLAGLLIAADRRVSKSKGTDYPFRYYMREGSGNTEHDKSALRAGHFPPKTGALKASTIQQRITFEWTHTTKFANREFVLSKHQSDMPICDLAGEDLCLLIEKVNSMRTLEQAAQLNANRIINMIVQSSGLMIIVKATRAQGLGIELEKEPVGIDGLSIYSDANMKRMIDGVIRFKKQNSHSPPLKGIAVIVTAWDGLAPVAEKISLITGSKFNPLDVKISQESLDKFMYMCYPSTHAAITSFGLKNIRYFPSFFEVERDDQNNPICWEGTNSPKICKPDIFDPAAEDFSDNVNTIKSSEFWFFKELDWMQETSKVS
jgi:hypothetical protein